MVTWLCVLAGSVLVASNCQAALLFILPRLLVATGGSWDPVLRTLLRWKSDVSALHIRLAPPGAAWWTAILARCPKRAPVAALVHWCLVLLSDAESFVGASRKTRSAPHSIMSLDTHDARAPSWLLVSASGRTRARRCRSRQGVLPG